MASTPDVGRAVTSMLEAHQLEVTRADDHRRAAEHLAANHFDVLLVEVKTASAGDGGLDFLRHVHASTPHLTPRIVVVSSDPPPSVQRELDAIGVCDIILKPVHEAEILSAIEECLDRTPTALQ